MTSGIKVLIVDDEAFNFEVLKAALPSRFELSYVESGEGCLANAMSQSPDIILLDVCMPGLDGYDTCRLIKNTPETQSIPVIMVSGLESENEKQEAFAAGCDDYLVKPYSMNDLVTMIDTFARH